MNHFLKFSQTNDLTTSPKVSRKRAILPIFNLIDLSFNVFNYLIKDFTITTNNRSYKFNSEMLKDTSSVIYDELTQNPTKLDYYLNIEDPNNVMLKIEQLYQGNKVSFDKTEITYTKIISDSLLINSFPPFLTSYLYLPSQRYSVALSRAFDVVLTNQSIMTFLQNQPQTFTISIGDKTYKCNILGVRSSKKILELLEKDPNINHFNYEVEDEYDDFKIICNLFNFKKIEITNNNMHSLQQFSNDLQIECIIEKVDKFIAGYENASQNINDKQLSVNDITQIYELLYNRSNESIEFIVNSIVNSNWVKTEEDVQELSACILQIINCSFEYHQYLYELIILLDKESKTYVNLRYLIPTVVDNLMRLFSQNLLICGFIYRLYKNGFITKQSIIDKFTKMFHHVEDPKYSNALSWFLPELLESEEFSFGALTRRCLQSHRNFLKTYYPHKMDSYQKMRDLGEPDDMITQALIHDDLDSFQKLISQFNLSLKKTVPFNLYDHNVKNGKTSYINYAAAYGSVHCFKYLFLNEAVIDKCTLYYAVLGENYEIIRTVDQFYSQEKYEISYIIQKPKDQVQTVSKALNPILPAILNHNDELFEWILQEKFINKGQTGNKLATLVLLSSMSGNAHSLISCIDNGLNINSIKNPTFCRCIGEASKAGFYKYIQLIFSFITKPKPLINRNISYSIFFGNLSIFQLILKNYNSDINNFDEALFSALNQNHLNIIKYILENCMKDDLMLTDSGLQNCLKSAIQNKSDVFNYLINKLEFDKIKILLNSDSDVFISILSEGCKENCIDNVKYLTNLILDDFPNADFTEPFNITISKKRQEIRQFFIEKNVNLNSIQIALNQNNIQSIDEDILKYLIKNIDDETKEFLFTNLFYPALKAKNLKIVEILLNKNVRCDQALFEAVRNDDIEMVKIVLKYKNKPYFINQTSFDGTALNVAVAHSNIEIVKLLLNVPGIDQSLCSHSHYNNPLVTAITSMNLPMVNLLLDHIGENIQSQMLQLNTGFCKLFNDVVNDWNRNKDRLDYGSVLKDNYYNDDDNNNNNAAYEYDDSSNDSVLLDNYTKFNDDSDIVNNNRSVDDGLDICNNGNDGLDDNNNSKNNIDDRSGCINDYASSDFYKAASNVFKRLIVIKDIELNCYSKNYNLLLFACQINDYELVKMLVESNYIDVNSYKLDSGCTALIVAIDAGNLKIAQLLIDAPNTNINQRIDSGNTALIISVKNGISSIVSSLINNEKFDPEESCLDYAFFISTGSISQLLYTAKGLNVNYMQTSYDIRTKLNIPFFYPNNCNGDNFRTTLIDAVEQADFGKIKMIASHPSFDRSKSQLKKAIFKSVELDNIDIFRILLTLIKDDVNICLQKGVSLFMFCIECHNLNAVVDILQNESFDSRKSDILSSFTKIFSHEKNSEIKTAAFIDAIGPICHYDDSHGHLIDFTKLLPNGESFFTTISHNFTNIGDIVSFFLDHGVKPDEPDQKNVTPLMHAIELNSFPFVHLLVQTKSIDFNRRFQYIWKRKKITKISKSIVGVKNNATYLHLAAKMKDPQILKELIELNVIDINSVDDKGETPLFYASRHHNVDNVKQLFSCENLDYQHRNNNGYDVINAAVKSLTKDSHSAAKYNPDIHFETKNDYLANLISVLDHSQ